MNKAHGNNFNDTLNRKGKGEKVTGLFNELIGWELVISVVVLITSHENRVYENHQDDEIVKHWPAYQLDGLVTEAVTFVEATK